MAFNPDVKRKIVLDRHTGKHLRCLMCGTEYPLPDAVHIIDEQEWKERVGCDRQANGIPLCPNCHRVFDEVLRPYLHRALESFGAQGLPASWRKNNKITVTEQVLGLEHKDSSETVAQVEERMASREADSQEIPLDIDVKETLEWIQGSGGYLALLRQLRQESVQTLAARVGVDAEIIQGIEEGEGLPSQDELIQIARGYRIDPRDIDEDFFYDDPNDKMKGGKIKDRDQRLGKPDDFWRWFHRRIKPQDPKRDWKNIKKSEFDELEGEWRKLGCPVPKEIVLPMIG